MTRADSIRQTASMARWASPRAEERPGPVDAGPGTGDAGPGTGDAGPGTGDAIAAQAAPSKSDIS